MMMNARTNLSQEQHRAKRLATGRRLLWTAKWSIGRRIALFLFGLFTQFAHSMFFRIVLVPGYEWLGPIDPLPYLLAEALAVATSFRSARLAVP